MIDKNIYLQKASHFLTTITESKQGLICVCFQRDLGLWVHATPRPTPFFNLLCVDLLLNDLERLLYNMSGAV